MSCSISSVNIFHSCLSLSLLLSPNPTQLRAYTHIHTYTHFLKCWPDDEAVRKGRCGKFTGQREREYDFEPGAGNYLPSRSKETASQQHKASNGSAKKVLPSTGQQDALVWNCLCRFVADQESDAQIENLRLAFESMDTNGTGKVNSDVRGNACGWCRYVLCSVHKFVIQFVLLCRYERLTHTCQADL